MARRTVLRSKIPQIMARSHQGADRVAENIAKAIEGEAKGRVQVLTGQTFRSIGSARVNHGTWMATFGATNQGSAGLFLEYGTVHHPAQPFAKPSARAKNREFRKEVRQLYDVPRGPL